MQIFSAPYEGSKLPYAQFYSRKQKFQGDGQWHKKTFEFDGVSDQGSKGDLNNLILRFGFGGRMGVYYIDDVEIEKI